MPVCKLYDARHREIRSFSLGSLQGEGAITVGRSERCAAPLTGPDANDAIAPVHFALVRRDNDWLLTCPDPKYPVEKNGQRVTETELRVGDRVCFGRFSLEVVEEKKPSDYRWRYRAADGKEECVALFSGVNGVGSAAESDIRVEGLAARHAEIRVDDAGVFLRAADPAAEVFLKDVKVGADPVALPPGTDFSLGNLKGRVVAKAGSSFLAGLVRDLTPEQRSWYLACCCVFALIVVLALVLIKIHSAPETGLIEIRKETVRSLPFDDKLIVTIWKEMEKGDSRAAISLLDNAKIDAKQRAAANELRDVLIKEKKALSDLKFYNGKIAIQRFKYIRPAFVKLLLEEQRQGSGEAVLAGDFWKNAQERLQRVERKLLAETAGVKARYKGVTSPFQNNVAAVKTGIDAMIAFYALLERANTLWDARDWKRLTLLLLSEKYETVIRDEKMEDFRDRVLEVSRFGEELTDTISAFQNSSLERLNIPACAMQIEQYRETLKKLEKNPLAPIGEFARRLEYVDGLIKTVENTRVLYDDWESDPDARDKTAALGHNLRTLSLRDDNLPVFKSMGTFIKGKMYRRVWDRLRAAKPAADREGVKTVETLMDYASLVDDPDESAEYLKLKEERGRLTREIEKKCDQLYYAWSTAKENGSEAEADRVIKEILRLAPFDNHYYKWAESEKKRQGPGAPSPVQPRKPSPPKAKSLNP